MNVANEQLSMDSILGDDEPKQETPVTEPTAPSAPPTDADKAASEEARRESYKSKRTQARDKEAIAQGKVRDPDTGQFVKAEEPAKAEAKAEPKAEAKAEAPPKPAAPQQDLTDKEKAFLRAAHEERGKRQELERQLAALNAAKVAPQPAAAAAPQEQPKTFWDDPEGGFEKHTSEIKKMLLQGRIQSAELIARQKHTDYDQTIEAFGTLLKQTPGLYEQWVNSPDPAEFAYGASKNYAQLQEVGSIEALRAKIEKETRVKIEAEFKEKAALLEKERAAIPTSLSDVRATGGATQRVWGGPPPMDEILKG